MRVFLKHFEGEYPIVQSLLFGSRARGDNTPDSDADLAVILEGVRCDGCNALASSR